VSDAMALGVEAAGELEARFRGHVSALEAGARVLELGTRRWEPDRPTHHWDWLPRGAEHVKAHYQDGTDVDVVADAHRLTERFPVEHFDAIIAVSVWEHLRWPWLAAAEAWSVLKPGGEIFVCTHQTFPLHGYPHDYFRFSTEAMTESLFAPPMWTSEAAYQYRCSIQPPPSVTRWNPAADSFLNVACRAIRQT